MTTFMNYLVEANISLLLLLGYYKLFLSKETNFNFQRYFLLAAICFSVAVPFLHFSSLSVQVPSLSEVLPSLMLPEIEVRNTAEGVNYFNILQWVYLLGVIVFTSVFLFRIFKLINLIQSATVTSIGNFRIVESGNYTGTFSFFNFIFIGSSESVSEQEKRQIIEHEQVHVIKYHSIDILILNVLSIVFWFNPFLRVYKKAFIQLHEFEADARAVENHDVNSYCNLLARVALQSFGFSLANHFNNSLTVKRILMIRSIKKKVHSSKLFLSIALFPCMFFILACQDQIIAQQPPKPAPSVSDEIYMVVEEAPTYPGGLEKLSELIANNLNYPKSAREKNVEGTVFVSFVVEKNGTVSNTEIVKGLNKECDEEAMRVVNLSETWNPGTQSGKAVRVKFVLPIKFKL